MPIARHRRTLKNGKEKVYTYVIPRRSPKGAPSTISGDTFYRSAEQRRIVAALQADSSLLVVGESGIGKTVLGAAVAQELQSLGFTVAIARPLTAKQALIDVATQLGVETETLEGKALTSAQLAAAMGDYLKANTAFLICDDAHRYTVQFRSWLEALHEQGQAMLLLATFPPARDIFLRLPRIELKSLGDRQIRAVMQQTAAELGVSLKTSQLAALQQRCGGNPMLARRVVLEEHLGLEDTSPDHTQWIDGTPFLVAGLMIFTVVRLIGLGLNSTTLYLVGGILTVSVGVVRILLFSLPKRKSRLGG
jgi:hypothetical protein